MSPFSLGTRILAAGAGLLMLFLLVGYLLPADWEAGAELTIPVDSETLFSLVDSPEGWQAWTPWPEAGVTRTGAARGAGARLSWDDAEVGAGSFLVSAVEPGRRVDYSVEIGGGAMTSTGSIRLEPVEGGTRVEWRERGDLGRNPLMGYWALSMERAQSAEMDKALRRLAEVAAR